MFHLIVQTDFDCRSFWQCHCRALDCHTFVLRSSAKSQIFCLSASGFRVWSLLLYNATWTNSHSWNTAIFSQVFCSPEAAQIHTSADFPVPLKTETSLLIIRNPLRPERKEWLGAHPLCGPLSRLLMYVVPWLGSDAPPSHRRWPNN